ncbi:MAG TPA: hypothetical protein VLL05_19295 [Terriglobales bacterium]|nr:hypothetical protein [Terriglobales bacterium]
MNIRMILNELKAERCRLDRAIAALEKIALASQKKRKSARSAQRRTQAGRLLPKKLAKKQPVQELQGKLLLFRKPRRARSKPSRAEEA